MGELWTNDDGLVLRSGPRDSDRGNIRTAEVSTDSNIREVTVRFPYDNLPSATAEDTGQVKIPAGSYLLDAYIEVDTAFAGGTSLNVGTEELDGTDIDADGIFNTTELATANLTAGAVIKASAGADVGTVISTTKDAYLLVGSTGTFTAGTAKLVVRYIPGYSA